MKITPTFKSLLALVMLITLTNTMLVFGQDAIVNQPGGSLRLLKTGTGKPRNVIFILTDDHRYDALVILSVIY